MSTLCWDILGIAPTHDLDAIRSAYRSRLPQHHPETDPEGFQRLRQAYEEAQTLARDELLEQPAEARPAAEPAAEPALLGEFRALLADPARRFAVEAWQAFVERLDQTTLDDLDALHWPLLQELLNAQPLAHACARPLLTRMAWQQRLGELDAQQAESIGQRLDEILAHDDLFDFRSTAAWSWDAQQETLWYLHYLNNLFRRQPAESLAYALQTHCAQPLPDDARVPDLLLAWCARAGIGMPSLRDLCLARLQQNPADLDLRYWLACQHEALGEAPLAAEQWWRLWQEHRLPQAADRLLAVCRRESPDHLPLLILALDQPQPYNAWPEDWDDMAQAYGGGPMYAPETLTRWARAVLDNSSGIADHFLDWRLSGYEQALLVDLLLDDGSEPLRRLYRHAWALERGDEPLLREVLAAQPANDPLQRLILEGLQQLAQLRLTWLEQAPVPQALRRYLAAEDAEPNLEPALQDSNTEAHRLAWHWLQRRWPFTLRDLQRLDKAGLLEPDTTRQNGLRLALELAKQGLEWPLPAGLDAAARWAWLRQDEFLLNLLREPQQWLRLFDAATLAALPTTPGHPAVPLIKTLQALHARDGHFDALHQFLRSEHPIDALLEQRLPLTVERFLATSGVLSSARLFECAEQSGEAIEAQPMSTMLLYAVLHHDPSLSQQQRSEALRTLANYQSQADWFEGFRNGLVRGKPVTLAHDLLASLQVPPAAYNAALSALGSLIAGAPPSTRKLRELQKLKDSGETPSIMRLAIAGLLQWSERLLLGKASQEVVPAWQVWRLGSRLGAGAFTLQVLGYLGLAGLLLFNSHPLTVLLPLIGLLGASLRRLHDIGLGLGMLMFFLVLAFILPFAPLALCFLPGDPLPNRYGPPPGSRPRIEGGGLQAVLRGEA